MHVRRLTAGIAAALLLPMGACSDGESKAGPPEPTATHSPTPSKSPTDGPTLPPEAQGTDEAAAKAFVRFYFELISDAMVTGDTRLLSEFSSTKCGTCGNYVDLIEETYAEGGSYVTRGWTVQAVAAVGSSDNQRQFAVRTRQHKRVLIDEHGAEVDVSRREVIPMRIILRPSLGSWNVVRLDIIQ